MVPRTDFAIDHHIRTMPALGQLGALLNWFQTIFLGDVCKISPIGENRLKGHVVHPSGTRHIYHLMVT